MNKSKQRQIEVVQRNSVHVNLNDFCTHSKQDHFMEVTEWSNGDGVDINLNSFKNNQFSLSWGEFEALCVLVRRLQKR